MNPSNMEEDSSAKPTPLSANGSVKRAKNEYLYKILVIGELGTGKTSFIKRYVHNFFSENYRATIGVDFALKMISWDDSTVIRLQLWDIAGKKWRMAMRFGLQSSSSLMMMNRGGK